MKETMTDTDMSKMSSHSLESRSNRVGEKLNVRTEPPTHEHAET